MCTCLTAREEGSFLFCGDLDVRFATFNRWHDLTDSFVEFDHLPTYVEGRLIGFTTCRVDPGFWRAIEESPQSKTLIDFTFPLPHLSMQLPEDAAHGLLASPWRKQLQVLQFGEMSRDWDAGQGSFGDSAAEGRDAKVLVELVEKMPQMRELYLGVWFEQFDPLLTTKFSTNLRVLAINTSAPLNLTLLAKNKATKNIETLIIVQRDAHGPNNRFHDHLLALVNSPHLANVKKLTIDLHDFDDKACGIVATAKVLGRLRCLRISGRSITDNGALALAECVPLRKLEDVVLDTPQVTKDGVDALKRAGIPIRSNE